jgi:Raf kinase inhibitor-like YbhB/YbcL family protein
MSKVLLWFIGIVCVLVIIFVIFSAAHPSQEVSQSINNNPQSNMALNIKSASFNNNGNIPAKYTCDGENINPPLQFEGVDPNAKSLVLIMDDPDAASVVGHTFDHWVKFNIQPTVMVVEEGKEPLGTAGKNGGGGLTYTGPCPPSGTHHYHFKLYSLDENLSLGEGATKTEVEAAMKGHILQEAELIGLYSRKV